MTANRSLCRSVLIARASKAPLSTSAQRTRHRWVLAVHQRGTLTVLTPAFCRVTIARHVSATRRIETLSRSSHSLPTSPDFATVRWAWSPCFVRVWLAFITYVICDCYVCDLSIKSSTFSIGFRGISRLGSDFIFLRWFKLAHICIQVTSLNKWKKQGMNREVLIRNRFHVTLRIVSPVILFTWNIWIRDWFLASFTCAVKLLVNDQCLLRMWLVFVTCVTSVYKKNCWLTASAKAISRISNLQRSSKNIPHRQKWPLIKSDHCIASRYSVRGDTVLKKQCTWHLDILIFFE